MTERPFRNRPPSSRLSPELVGTWLIGSQQYQITELAFYYVFQNPLPYTISEPELDWNGWKFKRIMGSSGALTGVWQDPSTNEEMYLRNDGSLTWYDPNDGTQLFGSWRNTSNPDKLGTSEARSFLVEKGNRLTFYMIFGGEFTYKFKVTSTTLTLTDPASGQEIVYTRA